MFEGRANKISEILFGGGALLLAASLATSAQAPVTENPTPSGAMARDLPAPWIAVAGPRTVRPGAAFPVTVRVRNGTGSLWEARGANRAVLSALVVDGNGSPWPGQPRPAPLLYPTPSGTDTTPAPLLVPAPSLPGRYTLLIGLARIENAKAEALKGTPLRWSFTVEAPPRKTPGTQDAK